jgi:3'-phosphoadenosine 5'-phosphosulfate sulfotransferase (PAPS reductase)/FAD synthetase
MDDLLLYSKEIYQKALLDYKPNAIVLMFSGGDDSLTAYHVARELGIKFDAVIHGNTRTGIPETTEFSRKEVERLGDKYIEADAGSSYMRYILRKGFFGKGVDAHMFSYHILKQMHFERVVSAHLRQRRRNFRILFINGARRTESANRMITMKSPFKITPRKPNDIWVNLINEFSKYNNYDYLAGCGVKRNPVAVNLCRSGECMCGTMQSVAERSEASYFYPEWGNWLNKVDAHVIKKHGFGWNSTLPIPVDPNQLGLFEKFQPMCTGCKVSYDAAAGVDKLPEDYA